jgi:hypothetical protein
MADHKKSQAQELYRLRRKEDPNELYMINQPEFLIGRGRECNLRVDDPKVEKMLCFQVHP